mmetsp:Transcript_8363/g.35465  ORF Transcript_8363/g.35465 Transcript_8363/m.35465 type:complete len:401 (-) Transcript_8363:785-1987(-)
MPYSTEETGWRRVPKTKTKTKQTRCDERPRGEKSDGCCDSRRMEKNVEWKKKRKLRASLLRRRRHRRVRLQVRDARCADQPLGQLLVRLPLHQEAHVHHERPDVPQHEPHHVVRHRAAPDVDVNLQKIRSGVVPHLQSLAHDERLRSDRALHDPRPQRDVRDELQARVAVLLIPPHESPKYRLAVQRLVQHKVIHDGVVPRARHLDVYAEHEPPVRLRPAQYLLLARPRRPRAHVIDAAVIHEPVHGDQVRERLPGEALLPVPQVVDVAHAEVVPVGGAPRVAGLAPRLRGPAPLAQRPEILAVLQRRAPVHGRHRRAALVERAVVLAGLRARLEETLVVVESRRRRPGVVPRQAQATPEPVAVQLGVGGVLAQLAQARDLRAHRAYRQRRAPRRSAEPL